MVGTIFTSNEPSGVFGASQITAVAESLGLHIESSSIVTAADLPIAAEGLISKGIEAFILPTEATVASGLPAIMQVANEHSLPVMYTAGNVVYRGATIGAGVYSYFKEGVTPGLPEVNPYLDDMTPDERWADDLAFLDNLRCTDEMIAEQQAQLDADSE